MVICDPFKGCKRDLQRSGMKRARLESPGPLFVGIYKDSQTFKKNSRLGGKQVSLTSHDIPRIYTYNIYLSGTQMTLLLVRKGLVLGGSTPKIEDKQVPGVYIYIYTWNPTDPCFWLEFRPCFGGMTDLKKNRGQLALQVCRCKVCPS